MITAAHQRVAERASDGGLPITAEGVADIQRMLAEEGLRLEDEAVLAFHAAPPIVSGAHHHGC